MDKLYSSENLCKLLYYNEENPIVQPILMNPKETLEYVKIFPYPKDTKIIDEASSILIVGFDNFKAISNNNFIGSLLYFKILCHNSLLRLDTGRRTYQIMNEIANLFNGQKLMGIGRLVFAGGGEINDGNDEYSGFELAYKIMEFGKNFTG